MQAARNIAIIALLALVVAAVPGGGDLAAGILAAFMLLFLALIATMVYITYRQNRLSYLTLPESQRAILLGSIGALALILAGTDELLDTSLGVLVWIAVIAAAVFAIVSVVRRARAY